MDRFLRRTGVYTWGPEDEEGFWQPDPTLSTVQFLASSCSMVWFKHWPRCCY